MPLQAAESLREKQWVQAAGKIHFAVLAHLRMLDDLDSTNLLAPLMLLLVRQLLPKLWCWSQRPLRGCFFHSDNLVL